MEEYVEPEDEYDGLEREVGEGMKGGGREARREEEWRKHEGRREGGTKGGGREEEWRKHEGRREEEWGKHEGRGVLQTLSSN
jgi:hypothetical protein